MLAVFARNGINRIGPFFPSTGSLVKYTSSVFSLLGNRNAVTSQNSFKRFRNATNVRDNRKTRGRFFVNRSHGLGFIELELGSRQLGLANVVCIRSVLRYETNRIMAETFSLIFSFLLIGAVAAFLSRFTCLCLLKGRFWLYGLK